MAVFSNLHHVGEVLVEMIDGNLPSAPSGTVQVGPPLETSTGATEDIRVTLLWVTPQATHRNDVWELKPGGGRRPPPLTLSAYFLITTYGSAAEDPIRAHELLGNVMQIFHTEAQLTLPLATLSGRGEGTMSVVQVPLEADMLEKIYAPLSVKLRPWVLFECGPIQLPHNAADAAPAPVVAPGGIHLDGPQAQTRPQISRVTPNRQARGGRIRVDVELHGRPLEALYVEGVATLAASATELISDEAYAFALPNTPPDQVLPGTRAVRVGTGSVGDPPQLFSEQLLVQVLDSSTPTLDAPIVATHSLASDLVLDGRELDGLDEVVFWPDAGVTVLISEGAVTPATFDDTSITITSAELGSAGLTAGAWRISARVDGHVYTPFVIVEVTA